MYLIILIIGSKKIIISDWNYFSGGNYIKDYEKNYQNSYFWVSLPVAVCEQLYCWSQRYIWTNVSNKYLYCEFPGGWNLENYMNILSYSLAGNHTRECKFKVFSDFPKSLIVFISFYFFVTYFQYTNQGTWHLFLVLFENFRLLDSKIFCNAMSSLM